MPQGLNFAYLEGIQHYHTLLDNAEAIEAVIITATRIKSMTTFQWVCKEVERMTKRQTASQVKRSGSADELNLRLVS